MKKQIVWILIVVIVLLASSVGVVVLANKSGFQFSNQKKETEDVVKTFAEWTDVKYIKDLPAMIVKHGKIGTFSKDGGNCSYVDVNGSTISDYQDYLKLLEKEGFKRYVDNGENGLNSNVYNAVYTKDELVVTVMHMVKLDKTYIAAEETPLSEHLIYSEDYAKGNKEGAKNILHMLELSTSGNCFILQMKNGHFIVMDGGNKKDANHLLTYLESLTPEGEKPVIEAWMISHSHADHTGLFKEIMTVPGYSDRVVVDGIYYDSMNSALAGEYGVADQIMAVKDTAKEMKTQSGEQTPIHRPHAGQVLYFGDISII